MRFCSSSLFVLVLVDAVRQTTWALSSRRRVIYRSQVGADPNRPQKVNQDAVFHVNLSQGKRKGCLVGVMDGHGLKGHLVTQYLAEQLPKRITQQFQELNPQREWETKMKDLANFDVHEEDLHNAERDSDVQAVHHALRHAFHQAHIDAINTKGIPAGRSGTTCVVCLVDDKYLHVAHVGDSRAIWTDSDGSIKVLTNETNVMNMPREAARIQAGEGRTDGQGDVWYGPVGISMTRALGDAVMLRAGVVPTPVVRSFPLNEADSSFLILMTDGISDVLTNNEVAQLVAGQPSLEAAIDIILEQSRRNWIGDLPIMEEKVDDMSCAIVKLERSLLAT